MNTFRWIIIVTSFLLSFAGVQMGCEQKSKALSVSERESENKTLYQCPMHPQIVQDKPGQCPICGMPLVSMDQHDHAKDLKAPGHASVFISPEQQQLIGVQTAPVEEKPLVAKVRTLGRVGYDPDLFESILEYQEAAAAFQKLRGNPSTIVKERRDQVHELAMLKLRLAGLSDEQISDVTKAGQLVTHYALDPDARWIYADIYEHESNLVFPGDRVKVTSVSLPGHVFEGEIRSVDPLLYRSSAVQRARIELKPYDQILRPGITVTVEIQASLGTQLAIPHDAVIDTGDEQIVFVDQGGGHFEPRMIQVGYETENEYEVLTGLQAGEKVVRSATFLVDSESRLRAAAHQAAAKAKVSGKTSEPAPTAHQHGG